MILSLLVLGAHFLRAGQVALLGVVLILLVLLAVRRPWVARTVQVALLIGAVEWVRTLWSLAAWRMRAGEPAARMVIILGMVALVTALSSLCFRAARMRRRYGRPQPQPSGSWLGRNWKWLVPVIVLACLVALAGFVLGIVTIVFQGMKSTEVYAMALQQANVSPAAVEALGAPIVEGWWVTGDLQVDGSSGNADLSFAVEGAHGAGVLRLVAGKQAGRWRLHRLELTTEGSDETIRLAPSGAP